MHVSAPPTFYGTRLTTEDQWGTTIAGEDLHNVHNEDRHCRKGRITCPERVQQAPEALFDFYFLGKSGILLRYTPYDNVSRSPLKSDIPANANIPMTPNWKFIRAALRLLTS